MVNSQFKKIKKDHNFTIENHNTCLCQNMPTFSYRCNNDADWTMNYLSNTFQDIIEMPTNAFLQRHNSFGLLIDRNDANMIWEIIQKALLEHRPFQVMYRLTTPNKIKKVLFEQGQGVYATSGELLEIFGFISDITSCKMLSSTNTHHYYKNCINELTKAANLLGLIKSERGYRSQNWGQRHSCIILVLDMLQECL